MGTSSLVFSVCCGSVLASGLFAQAAGPILSGSASSTAQSMGPSRRHVAIAPNGSFWAIVREVDGTGGHLLLQESTDGGLTWSGRHDTPTADDGQGAVVFGTACDLLHATWHALDGGAFANVYYQAFDTAARQWVGTPIVLAVGSGSNDQYYASDIEVTPLGTVVVAYSTHRTPVGGPWRGGWATGIVAMTSGGTTFGSVQQVNTDTYGVQLDMQAVGETVHMAFRTNTGLYGIRYRAFDTQAMAFTTAGDVQVDVGTANTSCIAADADGNLYVMYAAGGTAPGAGELRVAYAAAGNYGSWSVQAVAPDPDLQRGNVTYGHFSLAANHGAVVAAIYSRRTGEQHRNVWFRVLSGGVLVTPELSAASSSDADRFAQLAGLRNTQSDSALMAVTESRAAVHPGNRVDLLLLAQSGYATTFGRACQGSLARLPRLATGAIPATNSTLPVLLDGLPAGQAGVLFAGLRCLRTPLALDFLGMPRCALYQATPGYIDFRSDPSGSARIDLAIPANPAYAGLPILLQAFALAPGANAFGGVVTNGLMTLLR
jgi:hypothetical protein